MSIPAVLANLRSDRQFMSQVVAWERLRARPAITADLPAALDPRLTQALQQRGIDKLYTHQVKAVEAVLGGENVVVSTATASGKSLCYTIPVLQRLLDQPDARVLYLFPTKALAHDQMAETAAILNEGNLPITIHTYDGDTPRSHRRQIRQSAHILVSNPDMLHSAILPQHTAWRTFWSRLAFVVIDEMHVYRGVFGSHVANVLRRLQRVCRFYGSSPQFICCSATIANPGEHAERLVERPFTLVDESLNGAPRVEKHFIL
jgi:DEAD/DEAH box helicase domain-containing protein